LKNGFAGIRINLELGVATIVACCVLHNIAIDLGDNVDEFPEINEDNDNDPENADTVLNQQQNRNGNTSTREILIETFFSRAQPNLQQ
jgi:hypothetical protein